MSATVTSRVLQRSAVLAGVVLGASPLVAAEFTYNEKSNAEIARKLDMPVYFAVPASARLALPKTINTSDRLIEFKHPEAQDASGDVGLRVIAAKRAGFGAGECPTHSGSAAASIFRRTSSKLPRESATGR